MWLCGARNGTECLGRRAGPLHGPPVETGAYTMVEAFPASHADLKSPAAPTVVASLDVVAVSCDTPTSIFDEALTSFGDESLPSPSAVFTSLLRSLQLSGTMGRLWDNFEVASDMTSQMLFIAGGFPAAWTETSDGFGAVRTAAG